MIDATAHCPTGEEHAFSAPNGDSPETAFPQIIINGISGLLFIIDRNGALEKWNRNVELFLGLPPARLKGSLIERTVVEEDRARLAAHVAEAFANGTACVEVRMSGQSAMRYVRLTSTRIEFDGAAFLMGIGIDISDLKAVEALQAGPNRVLVSLSTGESLKQVLSTLILAAESQCEGMLGSVMLLNEAGTHLSPVAGPSLPQDYLALSAICRSGRRSVPAVPRRFIRSRSSWKTSSSIPIGPALELTRFHGLCACWSYPIFSTDKRILGTFAMYYRKSRKPDATLLRIIESGAHLAGLAIERHRAEAELKAAKEVAEAANRAKSMFLVNMSHELRTPLNGVVGAIDLLQRSSLNPEQQNYARIAQSSASALLGLIRDILDFSKIEAGKMELETVEFPLRQLIIDLVETLQFPAREKGISLHCNLPPQISGQARGDPHRLRQILSNLLSNALKFTDHGSVNVDAQVVDSTEAGTTFRFAISDTGIGIAPETLQRLFHSFSQADSSTTRKYGGTGLGLAICKRLTELMGGTIDVESVRGRGSKFSFTVRLQHAANAGNIGRS